MLKGIINGVPKDITRIAMKGKNLFDKDHADVYNAYLRDNNGWMLDASSRSVKIPIKGNTEYTLSISSENNSIFRICETSDANAEPSVSGTRLTRIVRGTTIKSYTFTTSSDTVAIIFQGSYGYFSEWLNSLMLVEGSQALPYEPYGMQQGWEVRDQQGAILWGANKTITANTGSISYKGYGLPLNGVEIEGNMAQTGTPDQATPIWPEETGERTANMFDYQTMANGTLGYYLKEDGSETSNSTWAITDYIPCDGVEFTVAVLGGQSPAICLYDENKQYITGKKYNTASSREKTAITITANQTAKFIRFSWCRASDASYDNPENIMLNSGSSALSYEPFGYKVTVTNGGNTYNVYLTEPIRKIGEYSDSMNSDGTVTRRIKKQAITELSSTDNFNGAYTIDFASPCGSNTVLSNIAESTSLLPTAANRQGKVFTNNGRTYIGLGSQPEFPIAATSGYPTVEEKAAFTLYISNHEVYVWYVLATPVTESIQFPEIETTDGSNTLSVGTILPPSKISITGHIKDYNGYET